MAQSVDVLAKKLMETKIADDVFFGKDLSHEQNFLNAVTEKFCKELEHCEVSTCLSKTSMTIHCESYVLTKVTGKKLLKVVDRLLDEYFFQAGDLHQLGWCSNYMLDKRVMNYPEGSSSNIQKTSIIEFYWFNHSPNMFNKQKRLTEVEVFDCLHCHDLHFKTTS